MLEAKLTIEIPGLATALEKLAAALSGQPAGREGHAAASAAPAAPAAPAPASPPIITAAPVSVSPAPAAPVHSPAAPQSSSPTGPTAPVAPAPSFTVEQIQKAGGDLIAADPQKMPELLALLQQFGVPAVAELRPEQLGAFATALRQIGGRL